MKYKQRLHTIDAIQWTGDNVLKMIEFFIGTKEYVIDEQNKEIMFYHKTEKGLISSDKLTKGDWLVKYENGGLYRYENGVFKEHYELA